MAAIDTVGTRKLLYRRIESMAAQTSLMLVKSLRTIRPLWRSV
jgi:hypothetical protein